MLKVKVPAFFMSNPCQNNSSPDPKLLSFPTVCPPIGSSAGEAPGNSPPTSWSPSSPCWLSWSGCVSQAQKSSLWYDCCTQSWESSQRATQLLTEGAGGALGETLGRA